MSAARGTTRECVGDQEISSTVVCLTKKDSCERSLQESHTGTTGFAPGLVLPCYDNPESAPSQRSRRPPALHRPAKHRTTLLPEDYLRSKSISTSLSSKIIGGNLGFLALAPGVGAHRQSCRQYPHGLATSRSTLIGAAIRQLGERVAKASSVEETLWPRQLALVYMVSR